MDEFMKAIPGIMETLMVIGFGISWPLNITKAWKARTAKSTSLPFYLCIWSGYIFAIIGKLVAINIGDTTWEKIALPFVFYFINFVMVSGGILIYFRNKLLDRMAEKRREAIEGDDE